MRKNPYINFFLDLSREKYFYCTNQRITRGREAISTVIILMFQCFTYITYITLLNPWHSHLNTILI